MNKQTDIKIITRELPFSKKGFIFGTARHGQARRGKARQGVCYLNLKITGGQVGNQLGSSLAEL